jgi:predicted small lipoprotein YifL
VRLLALPILLCITLLAGCGQKGALYLPPETPPAQPAQGGAQ